MSGLMVRIVGSAAAVALLALVACETGGQQSQARMGELGGPGTAGYRGDAAGDIYYGAETGARFEELDVEGDPPSGSARVYYPTGERGSSVIMLEQTMPETIRAGRPFGYEITVTNLTSHPLHEVVVIDEGTGDFQVQDADPQAQMSGGNARWELGTLEGNESETITVSAVAQSPGQLRQCALVTYMPGPIVCLTANVIQPELQMTLRGPERAIRCDTLTYTLVVENTGVGAAENVTIQPNLPAGLRLTDRDDSLEFGALDAGDRREITFTVEPEQTGQFNVVARAESMDGLTAEASIMTVISQPVLEIQLTGPDSDYTTVPMDYQLTITNTGDFEARDLVVTTNVPGGTDVVEVGGQAQPEGGNLRWSIGTLAPGDSESMDFVLRGMQNGTFEVEAVAEAYCAETVRDEVVTQLQGVPALVLEMVDLQDPVRVGGDTTYDITVANQGTEPATNIVISAALEQNLEFVSGDGPSQVSEGGQNIEFAALPRLGPGEAATWRVIVRAVEPGDIRFGVTMNADQLDRPVEETESTRAY